MPPPSPGVAFGNVAAELRSLSRRATRLQSAISPAVAALARLGPHDAASATHALQDLDGITQSLEGLAAFVESLVRGDRCSIGIAALEARLTSASTAANEGGGQAGDFQLL